MNAGQAAHATVAHNTFDTSIVEVKKEDLTRFMEELQVI
jgi:hypothetical protein